ncbi:MAG TPA: pyridoxine 5'-phosphate synthase [Nitrospirae bacterium]|nr:pyridoxine 5'-phosphate synthase [Nitrospirota bacterium]
MILGVNVDHIATLRQARRTFEPDPVMAATLALLGGADGITVHLREDRRHIQDRDLRLLREVVPVELNLEMAATEEMIDTALQIRPDLVTIVPEKREELTTEGGLDLHVPGNKLRDAVQRLGKEDIPVSFFIAPSIVDVDVAKEIGAAMVEVHTGHYANARGEEQREELKKVMASIERARLNGLYANAGHGLTYYNIRPVASIEGLRGLYIGHSIISRAVLVGMERAVREMKELVD